MNKAASFTIGKVTGVHGLGGNLTVRSFADSVDTFSPGTSVLLKSENQEGRQYTILKASAHKKGILLTLEGIDSRNLAEDLVG
ncbi:MAG: 16S rRNA processing protein RimM, partial [Proteobacteria bacterium]|nr:16S rRNA processing protein RimM [Pseudomonadota bacterium]